VSVTDMSQFEGFNPKPNGCAVCEAMLPEAVDGALSSTEQTAFDKHVAGCVECARELAEAQRGRAWLGMLKAQTPEPPAHLLAKILAETSGMAAASTHVSEARRVAPAYIAIAAEPEVPYDWTPRPVVVQSWSVRIAHKLSDMFSMDSARATFQPRMAMTAAMAFFSIALTLNLMGVRLNNLHASSFTPSGLKRTAADMDASVTRTVQNNRMVYQMESKVSELRQDDAPQPQNEGRSGR
jgi:anti-sigma factor RsiW